MAAQFVSIKGSLLSLSLPCSCWLIGVHRKTPSLCSVTRQKHVCRCACIAVGREMSTAFRGKLVMKYREINHKSKQNACSGNRCVHACTVHNMSTVECVNVFFFKWKVDYSRESLQKFVVVHCAIWPQCLKIEQRWMFQEWKVVVMWITYMSNFWRKSQEKSDTVEHCYHMTLCKIILFFWYDFNS